MTGGNGGPTRQLKVRVVLNGTRPLLQDCMSEETIESVLIRRQRKPAVTDLTREQMAAEKLYHGPDGELGIPMECLFAALREAGRLVRYDGSRRHVSSADSSLLASFLTIEEGFFPFGPKHQGWEPDLRRGQLKDKARTACGIIRPKFLEWGITATVVINTTRVAEETVRRLFDEAGMSQGLCSFRPSRNGVFGTFEVADWVIIERDGEPVKEGSAKKVTGKRAVVGAAATAVLALLAGLAQVLGIG